MALFPLLAVGYGPDSPPEMAESWGEATGRKIVHLAETRDGPTYRRYVNGELVYEYIHKEPESFSSIVPFSGFPTGSVHCERIDDVERNMFSGDDGEIMSPAAYEIFWMNINYRHVFESYSRAYVAAIGKAIGCPLEFEEMVRPRYYNFETDRLFARIRRSDLALMLHAVRGKRLEDKASDWFTSRSGFHSSYSSDIERWGRVADWDHNQIGAVLSCYVDLLREQGRMPEPDELSSEKISSGEIEEWLEASADKSPLAWAALKLSDLVRQRRERAYQSKYQQAL
jgi:hypothetical protein